MAVRSGLLFCCPSHVKCKLLFSDVKVDRCGFSGSQHAENTWQTEAPGLLGQSTANDSMIAQVAPGPHQGWRQGETGVMQDQDHVQESRKGGRNCSDSSLLPGNWGATMKSAVLEKLDFDIKLWQKFVTACVTQQFVS